jgi:hypothetical protein
MPAAAIETTSVAQCPKGRVELTEKLKTLSFGECFDDVAGELTVTLPVLPEAFRADDALKRRYRVYGHRIWSASLA